MESLMGLPTPPPSVASDSRRASHEVPLEKRWWNISVSKQEQRTFECPKFLQGLSQKDMQILSTNDENHPRTSWMEVKRLIDTNRIDQFHRMPSDLRKYIEYCHGLKQRYGSILYFMQHERLNWPSLESSNDAPFCNDLDYKILQNDWPYAIDQDIIHLVVWTKFALEEDPKTGQLTDAFRERIERFVRSTFCNNTKGIAAMERDDIRWFKNWKSLRSVNALEHFHVMLYKPSPGLIQQVTNGDRPMYEQFQG